MGLPLPAAQWTINNSPHHGDWSANKIVFGRELVSFQDHTRPPRTFAWDGDGWVAQTEKDLDGLRAKLEKERRKLEQRHAVQHGFLEVALGSWFWVYRNPEDESITNRKLLPRWIGPFEVVKALHLPNVWEVTDGTNSFACHVDRIKLASVEIPLGWSP